MSPECGMAAGFLRTRGQRTLRGSQQRPLATAWQQSPSGLCSEHWPWRMCRDHGAWVSDGTAREQTRGRSQGARAVRFVPLATPESVSWPRSRDLWKRSTAEARRRWRRKTTSSNRFAILNFLAIHTRKLIVWRWRFLPIIPSSCPLEKEAFWREQSAKYLAT